MNSRSAEELAVDVATIEEFKTAFWTYLIRMGEAKGARRLGIDVSAPGYWRRGARVPRHPSQLEIMAKVAMDLPGWRCSPVDITCEVCRWSYDVQDKVNRFTWKFKQVHG